MKKLTIDLSSAQILYDAVHFTDSIGVDLHYAIEKLLKAFLAFENAKIPKIHDLPQLYTFVSHKITVSNEDILYIATKYHIEESYPQYDRALPSRKEITEVLDFANDLFERVCKILEIDLARKIVLILYLV